MRQSSSRRRFLAASGLVGAVGLAGCAGFTGPDVVEDDTQTYSVSGYDAVRLENRNGDVRVEAGDADLDQVTVEIHKRGRSQEAIDAVTVEDTVEDGLLTLESVYEDDFRFANASARLVVTLPDGVSLLSARTVNGDVSARGVVGDARLSSGNGDAEAVDVDGYVTVESANGDAVARGTTGVAGAQTANGEVDVEVYDIRDDVTLSSGNGDVEAGVGPALDADVELSVGNGDVEAEVELADSESSRRSISGRLGEGGPTLRCSSGNGDVRLYALEA
ncbi:DUF4097 family beta strand repeat-containing protein [Salinirubellus salinus]|uniref:DUF4097 family beta strand repeat-containing protein n=1 Tax=Salinirubellus salinus TaxID=1364945 RepID=A0A9E7U6R4_9EURY|nr:DUF4097 family beta strand repeat-containing protein [Salinirubellus salinus]UWM56715.1 DUF4097 family beta strand repeat-containing protein [Salinirubellus salinus]